MQNLPENKVMASRIFDAPVEQVWEAWAKPGLVMKWWAPDNFTSPSAKIDFRVGGTSLVSMLAPEELGGQHTYSIWKYEKIIPYQRIEFIHSLSDENGNKISPSTLGMPEDFPEDMPMEVIFRDLGKNKTEMTVVQHGWNQGKMREMAEAGLNQSLDKMVLLFQ